LWYAVLVGIGIALGGPLAEMVEGTEDGLASTLDSSRTPRWDAVSQAVSVTANTMAIVATALVLGLVLRVVVGRWLESFVLWAGVAIQSTVFLLTTLVVSRDRPDVEQLDPAPPTSSFPSGHTGAAAALYLGLAAVLAGRIRRPWLRFVVVAVLVLVPLAVGLSRLYRGMHHPTDVAFGLLNGIVAVSIARFATVGGARVKRPTRRAPPP